MRFRYHLQKIVDLKSNEKAQAEWLLSNAMSRLKVEEQTLDELLQTRRSTEEAIADASASRISAAELMMLQTYLQHIDSLIERKRQALHQARLDVEHKSSELAARMKDEKVWLKAKERRFTAYKAEFVRQEQAVLDEIAAVRFGKSLT